MIRAGKRYFGVTSEVDSVNASVKDAKKAVPKAWSKLKGHDLSVAQKPSKMGNAS